MTRSDLDDTLPASDEPHLTPPPGQARPASRPSIPPSASPTIPAPSERYRLGKELGRGGMGRVVEALDTQLGRTVALKEVLPTATEATERRFRREVQVTARLEHPSIVPLYDSGIGREGRPYYVMRRVSGRPLDEMIVRARGLDERLTLLTSMLQAIEAIAHAHKRRVIHRDLKPANILVGELGETVVIDWGLAKVLDEADPDDDPTGPEPDAGNSLQTQIGSIFGTPGFMSPEQARGEQLDAHGDVYALGACLYQLLAGAPPHSGNSATEMIDKTMRHDVKPLAELAPGTPPELVAIVNKALAYDAAERYLDAGALAEDVRRFLDGQLVAAHHYTSRQRLARLARRHRAVLAVAALAAVALAIFAWIGVSRIVVERDAAKAAQTIADQQRLKAEQANAQLDERKDELIIANAVNLVMVNPTQAVALLKQVPASSKHLAEARATAQSAVSRGVAFAMPISTDVIAWSDLSADSKLLAVRSLAGVITFFDLDRHKQIAQLPTAHDTNATIWAGNDTLLRLAKDSQLIEVRTGHTTSLGVPDVEYAAASRDGMRIVTYTKAGVATVVDRKTGAMRAVGAGRAIQEVAIAQDGSWYVLADDALLTVHDAATDVELTRQDVTARRIVVSSGRAFAVYTAANTIEECALDAAVPTWTPLRKADTPNDMLAAFEYQDDVLVVPSLGDHYWTYRRGASQYYVSPRSVRGSATARGGMALFASDSNSVFLPREHGAIRLVLPTPSDAPHIAADRHRAVVISQGLVSEFELDPLQGKSIPIDAQANTDFFGSDLVATWSPMQFTIDWVDIPAQRVIAQTPLDGQMFNAVSASAFGSLAMTTISPSHGFQVSLVTARASKPMIVGSGTPDSWALPVGLAGGATGVLFSLGDTTVRFKGATGEAKELVKVDGAFVLAVQLSPDSVAVLGDRGELVIANVVTSAIERHRIPTPIPDHLASDGRGALFATSGSHLLRWASTQWEQIADLPRDVRGAYHSDSGLALLLSDNSVYVFDYQAHTIRRAIGSSYRAPLVSADGMTLAALANPSTLQLVDVATMATWSLALAQDIPVTDSCLALSPDGRALIEPAGASAIYRTLPRASEDLSSWLEEQTNATVSGGMATLRWPWDLPTTP